MENKQVQPQSKQEKSSTSLQHDVQVGLLKRFKVDGTHLQVRTMSGRELDGRITRYDTFAIEFQTTDGRIHLLYKHGVEGFTAYAAEQPAA